MAKDYDGYEHTSTFLQAVRKFILLYRPDRRDIIVVFVYALAVGLLSLAVPVAAKSIVNTVTFGALIQPLVVLVILVLGGLLFSGIMRLLQIWIVEIIQRRVFVRVTLALANRLPRVRYEVFSEAHGPELVNRFLEIVTVQKVTAVILLEGVTVFFQTISGLLLLSWYHPLLLGFSVLILLGVGLILLFGWGSVRTAVEESAEKYEVLSWLEELARHPALYRTPAALIEAEREADRRIVSYLKARGAHFRRLLAQHATAVMLQAIGSAALLGVGAWLVIKQQLTLGQLVAAELVLTILLAAISKLGKHFESLYDLAAAADKLSLLFHIPIESQRGEKPEIPPGPLSIEIQNLQASDYFGRPLIDGLSLELPAGGKISIFGTNGSGKSVLANILFKLQSAQEGIVRVGGYDLRDLHPESVRSKIALIRGIEIFPGTIEENIRVFREGIELSAIQEALDAVGLLEGISQLPKGLQTELFSSGAPLSRGQALLLMFARALVGSPGVIIIDETLDGIDDFSVDRLYETLLKPKAPWTVIDFTHDFEVWEHFERHLVLEKGKLQGREKV